MNAGSRSKSVATAACPKKFMSQVPTEAYPPAALEARSSWERVGPAEQNHRLDAPDAKLIDSEIPVSNPLPRRLVRLLARDTLTPNVCAYRFRVEGDGPFVWAPGQYVELFAPSAPDLPLPYSIASAPDVRAPGEFDLAIGTGSGRELLAPLPVGAELLLAGPYGRMIWSPAGSSALLVGAGTGVAPLRALLQARLDGVDDVADITLLAGFRRQPDILWRLELEALARRHEHFRFLCTLSQPDETWSGLRGRVQEHVISLARDLRDPSVFLCGTKDMVEACGRLLVDEAGVPPGRILAEGY